MNILTILLNYNGKQDTLACLQSLQEAKATDVVVVDNGSTDNSVQAIRASFPHIPLLETGQNLGYSAGNNRAIEWGLQKGFKNFLLLNNDTVVAPDLLSAFQKALAEHPKVGIFGAKIYRQNDPSRLDHFGGKWNKQRGEIELVGCGVLDTGETVQTPFSIDYACGAALLVRREVFEKIGLLDPRYFLYWEDTDFCFSAKKAGFDVQITLGAKVWHKVSASTGKEGKPFVHYFNCRNQLLWIEKQLPWDQKIRVYYKILREFGKALLKLSYKNKKQKAMYKAQVVGVRDYFLRRFGAGSSKNFKAS